MVFAAGIFEQLQVMRRLGCVGLESSGGPSVSLGRPGEERGSVDLGGGSPYHVVQLAERQALRCTSSTTRKHAREASSGESGRLLVCCRGQAKRWRCERGDVRCVTSVMQSPCLDQKKQPISRKKVDCRPADDVLWDRPEERWLVLRTVDRSMGYRGIIVSGALDRAPSSWTLCRKKTAKSRQKVQIQ